MKVIWDPKAMKNRDQVADYIRRQFGVRRKIQFLQEVRETTKKLCTAPYIGTIDPLFENRARTYRRVIVNGLNKIVYFVEDDIIYIAAFWDTRMNDEELAAKVE